jgi:hypothetical protein
MPRTSPVAFRTKSPESVTVALSGLIGVSAMLPFSSSIRS